MKRFAIPCMLLILGMMLYSNAESQTCAVLKPSSQDGKDTDIWSNGPNLNFGTRQSNTVYVWTNNGALGKKRALIEFDLNVVPANATIVSASLSLFHNPTDPYEGFSGHTGQNEAYIQRIISSWDEHTVTWNNQPNTTTQNEVSLPASSSASQDYLNIDVTDMVVDMFTDSIGNHGFMIRLQNEQNPYKSILLASSDNPDSALHPELEICWEINPCTAIKPTSKFGKDADVWSNGPNLNFGSRESSTSYTWTNGGSVGIKRSLLAFQLNAIPANATILGASLSLFYNPTDPYEGFSGHSGQNEAYIQRIISPWGENTVTWNNQPSTTTQNQVSLPISSSPSQDYLNIDVTDMVVGMFTDSIGNHGFMIRMQNEQNPYRSLLFASSDHADPALHPVLEICWRADPSSTTNIGSSLLSNAIRVFPNPSNGVYYLEIEDFQINSYRLEITNTLGQILLVDNVNNPEYQIDLSNFSKGIYYLTLRDQGKKRITKKLILE